MKKVIIRYFIVSALLTCCCKPVLSQKTIIRGFVDATSSFEKGKLNFGLGEQDLFITSELNDRISFLGESVFKFSLASATSFDVSIERVVLKYNYYGNHNVLVGKQHTPVNYWNYTYHHGRVFFPTIERPLLFAQEIIPLHTTGIGAQAQNLGRLKVGYDFLLGNGLGSNDLEDNDKRKSVTAGVHIKPADGLTLGSSYYNDVIAKGAQMHDGHTVRWKVNQQLYSATVAWFGKKYELLAEGSLAHNRTDTTGCVKTAAGYVYAGARLSEKWVPYVRLDNITYGKGEVLYDANNQTSFIAGLRYEINFLSAVKVEFQHTRSDMQGRSNKISAQFAIGF